MKTFKLFSTLIALFAMLVFISCGDDEADPLVSVNGKITFTNAAGANANAAGAVVYLTGTSTTISTIADENGAYTFTRVDPGTYMLNAEYFTDNKNITSRLDGLNFAPAEPVDVTVGKSNVTQDLPLVSIGQSNLEAISASYQWDATGGSYANTGTWTYDATHSPINFEFGYRDNAADFTGSFGQLSKAVFNFDPANLTSSTLDFTVDLASINTRSSGGRDNLLDNMDRPTFSPLSVFEKLGCIMGTFGLTADGTLPSVMTSANRYASFTSSSISKLGDGYVAKGNLVFNGVTKATEIWFKGVPSWLDASNSRTYSGFEGRFFMNAKADYNITSSSVNDATIGIHISIVIYKQ